MQSRLRNGIPATLALALVTPAAAVECMHPSHVPSVAVDTNEVCWSAVPGARGYDVALGLSLAELGSQAPSLAEATLSCLGAGRTETCIGVPFDPAPGDGFYFTVRANRGNSAGTYETGCPAEAPGRDEAFAAALTCP